jgi:hypothetical protein
MGNLLTSSPFQINSVSFDPNESIIQTHSITNAKDNYYFPEFSKTFEKNAPVL